MLHSRFTTPELTRHIARPRLFTQLDEFSAGSCTWIQSPPGSGKTTLISSYVHYLDCQCMWYQMETTDSDVAAFFQYLGTASDPIATYHEPPLPKLTPEYLPGLPVFTQRFCEQLFARLPSPCLLVFDNYQELDQTSDLHGVIAKIIDLMPPDKHVIAISRQSPPKSLARLRVNGQIKMLEWQDIRFTPAECRALLESKGLQNHDLMQQIIEIADGWAAGMILMQATNKAATAYAGQADHQLTFDYFATEILQDTPPQTLDMLMQSALFPNFSASMLAALIDQDITCVTEVMQDVYRKLHFVEKHQVNEPYYQYHPLFRQYLLSEGQQHYSRSGTLQKQRHAAEILSNDGQIEAAAELMLQSEAWDLLTKLCLENAESLLTAGRHQTLLEWIKLLPTSIFDAHPRLHYRQGAALLGFDPQAARCCFERAYAAYRKNNDIGACYLSLACIMEATNYEWDDFRAIPRWVNELNELEKNDGQYPDIEIEGRIATALLAMSVWSGGIKITPQMLTRCNELLCQIKEPNLRTSLAASILGFHNSISGDALLAGNYVNLMYDEIEHIQAEPRTKIYWYCLCIQHYINIGRYEQALLILQNAVDIANKTGIYMLNNAITIQGLMVFMAMEDVEKAASMLAQFNTQSMLKRRVEYGIYLYFKGFISFYTDPPEFTQSILEQCFSIAVDTGTQLLQVSVVNALFLNSLRLNDLEKAEFYYEHFKEIIGFSQNRVYHFQLLLVDAIFSLHKGDEKALKRKLETVLQYARNNRIIGVTLNFNSVVSSLYGKALIYGVEEDYAKMLSTTLRLKPDSFARALPNWPWKVRIYTLGRDSIELDGKPRQLPVKQRRVLELLRLLLISHSTVMSKNHIIEVMWPEFDGDKAEQNFKSTTVRLRKLIGKDVLVWRNASLELNKDLCWVDIWAIESLLDRIATSSDSALNECFRSIAELYQGQAFAVDNDYRAFQYGEKLHQQCCKAFVDRAGQLFEFGQLADLIDLCISGLKIDEATEPLHQYLIRAYVGLGKYSDAKKAYQLCVDIFLRELHTTPSMETKKLLAEIDTNAQVKKGFSTDCE